MQIAVASENMGKIAEINSFFAGTPFTFINQEQFNIPSAIEDRDTFVENAIIKAKHLARHTDLPVISDDSGLIIDALGGAPGVISARYAGEGATWKQNIDKVISELQARGVEQSPARFVCVIILLEGGAADPLPKIYQGVWEGLVMPKIIGDGGFGYDPIFYDPETKKSAAELTQYKATCSHRVQALTKLRADLVTSSGS